MKVAWWHVNSQKQWEKESNFLVSTASCDVSLHASNNYLRLRAIFSHSSTDIAKHAKFLLDIASTIETKNFHHIESFLEKLENSDNFLLIHPNGITIAIWPFSQWHLGKREGVREAICKRNSRLFARRLQSYEFQSCSIQEWSYAYSVGHFRSDWVENNRRGSMLDKWKILMEHHETFSSSRYTCFSTSVLSNCDMARSYRLVCTCICRCAYTSEIGEC